MSNIIWVYPEWNAKVHSYSSMCYLSQFALDFDDILATVAFLLEQNPEAEFWTSYQERR